MRQTNDHVEVLRQCRVGSAEEPPARRGPSDDVVGSSADREVVRPNPVGPAEEPPGRRGPGDGIVGSSADLGVARQRSAGGRRRTLKPSDQLSPSSGPYRYGIRGVGKHGIQFLPIGLAIACLLAFTSPAFSADKPFGDNVTLRGSLDNSRLQFLKQKKGTVAFLGGSITEMNGYRPMVCDILTKRFPDTDFKFINAGISSTTSVTGAFRLASDVLADGPVDLLFVEYAVNDDQDGHYPREECIRGMEGIIRHARQHNPNMDIVMTFFVNESMLSTLQAGRTPLTIEAHEAVAKHYEIPTVNLAKEVAQEITGGTLTWKLYGGVHPAPFGNAICAKMIDELFNRAWADPLANDAAPVAHPMPADPVDPLNYERGHFIDLQSAKITRGWTLGVPDWTHLAGGVRDRFKSIPMLSAVAPGAELTLDFEGTAVGAYVVAGPDAGMLDGSVDGDAFKPVNLYHTYSKGLHYPRTVLFTTDLRPGKHTLVLRVANDTTSAGHAARIIHFVAN
jgi:lysophospholipase L1-like esterase